MEMRPEGSSFLKSCYVRIDAKIQSSKDIDTIREEIEKMNNVHEVVLLSFQLIK